MSEKKEQPQPEEIKNDTAEELGIEQLDEAHGGMSFGTISRTAIRSNRTLRPVAGNNVGVDVDACCTVYGGTSGLSTPLKR